MPRKKYAQTICALALITSFVLSPLPARASEFDDAYSGLSRALSTLQDIVLSLTSFVSRYQAESTVAEPISLPVSSSGVSSDIRALVSGQADANTRSSGRALSSAIADVQNSGTFTSPTISTPTITGGLSA